MTSSDHGLFYGKVEFGYLGFSIGKSENSVCVFFRNYCSLGYLGFSIGKKVKTVDFTVTETVAACDLKVGRNRHLIEYMKVCEY